MRSGGGLVSFVSLLDHTVHLPKHTCRQSCCLYAKLYITKYVTKCVLGDGGCPIRSWMWAVLGRSYCVWTELATLSLTVDVSTSCTPLSASAMGCLCEIYALSHVHYTPSGCQVGIERVIYMTLQCCQGMFLSRPAPKYREIHRERYIREAECQVRYRLGTDKVLTLCRTWSRT